MKIGFGRAFKSLDVDHLLYADIWNLLASSKPTASKPHGEGTFAVPYQPLGIGDWYWLSQQPVGKETVFIKVADRLIAKWGGAAKGLKSYTSDVTEVPPELLEGEVALATSHVVTAGESADKARGFDPKAQTVYTRKARRVAKVYSTAATKARQLLWGQTSGDDDAVELANTIAGLLISEGGADRDKSGGGVFMATFMLLDLIEKQICYGLNGQYYTWASMLMHAGASDAQPAPDDIPGRSAKSGLTRKMAKHPMAGFGTVNMGKSIAQNNANEARNRVISIATAWLANYLAEHDTESDYKYVFIRSLKRDVTPKTPTRLKSYAHLRDVSRLALQTRAVSTSCLLTGSKTKEIGYLDGSVQIWK
ncbi:hypothetical protein [Paraburkholderia sp. Cpub6]|uniref:hypothetical protein n=1 Tax=Paraburkholderia sp. Cpub6 TaxID=2723094 RepID=UPI0016196608|nr:hypothetical protein [Paraburkholderia sp. Cpub6]MBB5463442.1 hypothetical protein [Paraburkholderia sp. Cpub6]